MALILIASERFAEHQTPPGHPESPMRAAVMDVIAEEWRERGGEVVAPREASHEQLARVHDVEYLRQIAGTAGSARALDPDTYASPDSYGVALLAAGAAVDAVERVVSGAHTSALALVRPPGHHAERNHAMGFCFFNNIAVAAAHARTLGAQKVAIVDYDVHHGNGTQHTFDRDPALLYVSIHQYPFYPGTGAADEIGEGRGLGMTVNLPLEIGAADEDYRVVWREVLTPVLDQFQPDLVLVSAGFDAHERDPLGGMRLTTAAFAAMTLELRQVAERYAGGKLAVVTEGGYDLRALADSLRGVISALESDSAGLPDWPPCAIEPVRGRAAVAAVRSALGAYWKV